MEFKMYCWRGLDPESWFGKRVMKAKAHRPPSSYNTVADAYHWYPSKVIWRSAEGHMELITGFHDQCWNVQDDDNFNYDLLHTQFPVDEWKTEMVDVYWRVFNCVLVVHEEDQTTYYCAEEIVPAMYEAWYPYRADKYSDRDD